MNSYEELKSYWTNYVQIAESGIWKTVIKKDRVAVYVEGKERKSIPLTNRPLPVILAGTRTVTPLSENLTITFKGIEYGNV